MRCPNCGLENPNVALTCDCGYQFKTSEEKGGAQEPEKIYTPVNTFPILTLISLLLRICGWILIVFGVIFMFKTILGTMGPHQYWGQEDTMKLMANIALITLGLITVAIGELIGVAFAIEKNTRDTRDHLKKIHVLIKSQ